MTPGGSREQTAAASREVTASTDAAVPRRLRRGPKITLTCDCGERRDLHYGERWRCQKCGRTWDTSRIPAQDYAAVKRIQTRFVVVPIAMLLIIVATVVLFIIFGRVYSIILLPMFLVGWVMYGRPLHRRRLRRALDRLPEWKITPSKGSPGEGQADS